MQTRMDLKLRNPSEYFYLNRSSCLEIEGVSDMDMFSLTQKSFEELRFSSDEIEQIWTLVSSILQIGNLTFTSDGSDGSEVADISILKDVCSVLKVSPKLVEDSLCFRQVTIRNEVQKIKQDPEHASNARDSLAKTLYEYLFEWLVSKCNLHLSEAQTGNVIGVLDIFGFGIFFYCMRLIHNTF